MQRFIKIKDAWEDDVLSDGEALDEVLEILETEQPALRKIIIETDGDDLTDCEALLMVWNYYHIDL